MLTLPRAQDRLIWSPGQSADPYSDSTILLFAYLWPNFRPTVVAYSVAANHTALRISMHLGNARSSA
jgi:hypothetical protein